MLPESEIEPVESLPDAEELPDDPDGAPGRARPGRGDQAERRPRHEHGHEPRQVAPRGEGRPVLPRRDRPPGADAPGGGGRARAAGADEQLRHARGLAGGAQPLPGSGGRRPARLRAGQGPEAARGRPRAGQLARRPEARVGAARARRPVPVARRVGDARRAARARVRVRLRLELGQPRRHPRPADPGLVRARAAAVPDGGGRPDRVRPQGRSPGPAARGRAGPARDRADAGRATWRPSRT